MEKIIFNERSPIHTRGEALSAFGLSIEFFLIRSVEELNSILMSLFSLQREIFSIETDNKLPA